MRYHFISMKMAIIKEGTITRVGKDLEKSESVYTTGGNVKWCNCFENSLSSAQKVELKSYTYDDLAVPLLVHTFT